jgi:hypothetical protein
MSNLPMKQGTRVWLLLLNIGILSLGSFLAFGTWVPPLGDKGFWFYTAVLSLLLGSHLITPFYHKPVDVIAYTIPALVALFISNNWSAWGIGEKCFFGFAVFYSSCLALSAFVSILTKDRQSSRARQVSNVLRVVVDVMGSPQAIFSTVILFSLYTFHRNSPKEFLWVGLAWAFTVPLSPLETLIRLVIRVRDLFTLNLSTELIGKVVAYQTPGLLLIRQSSEQKITFGQILIINDPYASSRLGIVLDYVGRDEGMLIRAIDITSLGHKLDYAGGDSLPEGGAAIADISTEQPDDDLKGLLKNLVGIVAQETSIDRLYFEVIREKSIAEGKLVEATVGDKKVLYQIVAGLTKEEIVHQKNTFGYARAQAQKVGVWDTNSKKFKPAKWLPRLNSPVLLKGEEEYNLEVNSIGHFPGTSYSVSIKNIHDLVTHNLAILGILGIGKSMLSFELIERMLAENIKVICLDLTDEYSDELGVFYDQVTEKKFLEEVKEIGRKGKENVAWNVEEGGAIGAFSGAIEKHIEDFLKPGCPRNLMIFNPSDFEVWKQDSKQFQGKASMVSITPTEVTQIITEAALRIVQKGGRSKDKKARVCMVYEEAHSLVPEWNAVATEGDRAATNGTARAILQGRKFGLGCLLVTQRTASVTKTILNQCNTLFAMRAFDDTSKEFLSNYLGSDYASVLPSLREREAVVFGKGSSCENPVLIRLNDRDKFVAVFRDKYPPPELPVEEEEEIEAGKEVEAHAEDNDIDVPF